MKLPSLKLRLFKRERDGLFEEASGFGYAPIVLDPSKWDHRAPASVYPEQTFTFTGAAGWMRGWYVTDDAGATVSYGVCPPVEIKSRGDQLRIGIRAKLAHLTKGYDNGS